MIDEQPTAPEPDDDFEIAPGDPVPAPEPVRADEVDESANLYRAKAPTLASDAPPEEHVSEVENALLTAEDSGGVRTLHGLVDETGMDEEKVEAALAWLISEGRAREDAPGEYAPASAPEVAEPPARATAPDDDVVVDDFEVERVPADLPQHRGVRLAGDRRVRGVVLLDLTVPVEDGASNEDIMEAVTVLREHAIDGIRDHFANVGVSSQLLRIEAYDTPRRVFP